MAHRPPVCHAAAPLAHNETPLQPQNRVLCAPPAPQRGRRGSWMLARTSSDPAITRFASTAVPGGRPGLRAFLLKPETGRTHQLRVALKSLGAPVLGDARYAQASQQAVHDACLCEPCAAGLELITRCSTRCQRPQPGLRPPAASCAHSRLAPRARCTQADRARVEDRGYLHCTAMRFRTPGGLVQVVCRPEEGDEFQTDGFAGVFAAWFPPSIAQHAGTWFPEHKLLRSCMLEE